MAIDPNLLDNIDQFIKDEGRIVTYKWLSQQLSLDCRKAKKVLRHYVEKERSSQSNHINVIYYITGELKDDKGYKVFLVSENELNDCKNSFSSINSTEIYSVQNSPLKDISALYLADYEAFKDSSNDILMCNSNIICEQVKFRKVDKKPPMITTDNKKTDSSSKVTNSSLSNNKSDQKVKDNKKTLAGFWSDAAKPNSENKSVKKEIAIATEDTNKPIIDRPEATDNKGSEKVAKKVTKKANHVAKKVELPAIKLEVKSEAKERKMDEEKPKSKVCSVKQEFTIKHTSTSPQSSPQKSPQKPPQKRKLKMEEIEDELQEEDNENTNMDNEEDVDAVPNLPDADAEVVKSKRKRRKVLTSKVYISADGFMVTEKVWESQSESDNDEPEGKTNVQKETNVVKALPAARPANKKASGSSKAGKQSSLMSFFKKK